MVKNEMYDWAKSIIHETDIHHLFDRSYIFQLLDDHCTGKADNSRKLWTILMFLVWFQVFVEKKYAFHQVKTHEKEFVGL